MTAKTTLEDATATRGATTTNPGRRPRGSYCTSFRANAAGWGKSRLQMHPKVLRQKKEQTFKKTKRHENLQVNDICLIKYENKVASTYRLCRFCKLLPSADGLVRLVEVRLGKKKHSKRNLPSECLVTAVQRLVLLVPADELQPSA